MDCDCDCGILHDDRRASERAGARARYTGIEPVLAREYQY